MESIINLTDSLAISTRCA